jgi:snurportin-1
MNHISKKMELGILFHPHHSRKGVRVQLSASICIWQLVQKMSSRKKKRGFKTGFSMSSVDMARRQLLARQAQSREDLVAYHRGLAASSSSRGEHSAVVDGGGGDNNGNGMSFDDGKNGGHANSTRARERTAAMPAQVRANLEWHARGFMYPQWMTELPCDLGSRWLCKPRPEGARVVVSSWGNETEIRLKNGQKKYTVQSALPAGSFASSKRNAGCVLDCILAADKSLYVLDVMKWGGKSLYECPTEMRWFWLQSRLAEDGLLERLAVKSQGNEFPIHAVPSFACDPEGVIAAYTFIGDSGAQAQGAVRQDGILFYHKDTQYMLASTPLLLLWKDKRCSAYYVDNDGKKSSKKERVVLRVAAPLDAAKDTRMRLCTLEGYSLGFVANSHANNTLGKLLRFTIEDVNHAEPEVPGVAGLKVLGKASMARVLPDSWSKVVFQAKARRGQTIVIDEILQHAQESIE